MEYDEDYLVALVMLHGGRIWHPQWGREEYWVFEPGWDENKSFSLNHTRFGNSRFEAVKRYCLWKELIS